MMEENVLNLFKEFLNKGEKSRNNANFIESIAVLDHLLSGELYKWYLFKIICKDNPNIEHLNREGWIYIHQTSKLSPYCIGLSAKDIAEKGLQSHAKNERIAGPPKRLDTLFLQCANLICIVSQEISGAMSLNDLSTIAASYLYVLENIGYHYKNYELENIWQAFLYNVNLPFRSGNSPFTNITLEFGGPDKKLENMRVVYSGKTLDFEYNKIPPEYFDRINRAFIDAMSKGDHIGNPFSFPLITINIGDNFDYSNPVWKMLLEKSDSIGGFYIQNYRKTPFDNTEYKKYNPYIKPIDTTIYSNCCRMNFNIDLVETITGSNPFHSGSGIGGIGVVAININRILYICKDDIEKIKNFLSYLINIGHEFLMLKRNWIENNKNLYPYLSFYQSNFKSLYNIFSIVGVHEGLINAGFSNGIHNRDGKILSHLISQYILKLLEDKMRKDNVLISLEYAPSEYAACKLAKLDRTFSVKYRDYVNNSTIKISEDENINRLIELFGEKNDKSNYRNV